MDDPRLALTELQAALDNMRAALTSGDLMHLLAAQERCAGAGIPRTVSDSSVEYRRALRASLERARATLALCHATNSALLGIVEQCRTESEGPRDYTRAGGAATLPIVPEREGTLSCRA